MKWVLKWFEQPTTGYKKYEAVLQNELGEVKRVGFGDRRYEQYHDKIGKYSQLDHNDPKRRRAWDARHKPDQAPQYSPTWFAKHFLW